MYFILSKNNPYLEELILNPQGQTIQKDFDGMEIDLKNRFKSKNLELKDNYISNNFSDNVSEDDDTSKTDSLSMISSKSSQIGNAQDLEKQKIQKTIKHLKFYIHILNIISSFFIIISVIFSQFENDTFYFDNIYYRRLGALIVNLFDFNEENKKKAWEKLFNDSTLNLSTILERDGNLLSTLIDHYINNDFKYTKISNHDLLNTYNITLHDFNLDFISNYKDIFIPIKISDSSNKLRYIILSLSLISMFFLSASRYLSFYREKRLIQNSVIPFYKSKFCLILFFEVLFLLILPFPSLNYTWINHQLDRIIIIPLSSIFNAFLTFRIFYFFQLINSLSVWDSTLSEKVLDKFYLQPNILFTMKAYQKNNPFKTLIFLFTISCLSFALCIRVFEIYYWESFTIIPQDWTFIWNALWCIFVSMTTVGYGDFYPKTHFGRFIVIFSCIIGIYFTSMMMIFLTKKSVLNENELKSYKLITRLKIRYQLKDIHSYMIYHGFKMFIINKNYKSEEMNNQKKYEIEFNYEKRNIIHMIEKNKILSERIKSFDIIPTKDQLNAIVERIIIEIKEINNEVNILQKINNSFLSYTDTQAVMIKYLKKCIQNTKLMLDLINKKPKEFGELSKYNKQKIKNKMDKIYQEHISESINMDNINLNENFQLEKLFEDNKISTNANHYDEFFSTELAKYDVTSNEYKQHFYSLFFNESNQNNKSNNNNNSLKAIKTIKQMMELKKKIDNEYLQRRNRTQENTIVNNDDESEEKN